MPSILETYGYELMPNKPVLNQNQYPARVLVASVTSCRIISERGEALIPYGQGLGIPGRESGLCAGDWIAVEEAYGEPFAAACFPRKSALKRLTAHIGEQHEQLIAANMELTLIVTSANKEFKAGRLERYLAAAWESNSQPIIVLTKCDLHPNPEKLAAEAQRAAPGAEIYPISSVTGYGLQALKRRLDGLTSALVGSSGVGKSTLVNAISGDERMYTQDIREDDAHGRHTTSHRELLLAGDVILIDTPGMREFGLWDADMDQAFPDIVALSEGCRFRDCKHDREPGCAVKAAVEAGTIEQRRLVSYRKLMSSKRTKPSRKTR